MPARSHLGSYNRFYAPPWPQTSATGTFNRALGASGFSLVNVANVPIGLGRWMVGNDPANRCEWLGGAGGVGR